MVSNVINGKETKGESESTRDNDRKYRKKKKPEELKSR